MDCARGLITEIDPAMVKAKAKLPDMDGIETDWLPVLQTFTKGAASFSMPRVDQQVYVFFVDEQGQEGFIFGARYSQKSPPPEGVEQEDCYWALEDGTKIHLAPNAIKIETPGDAAIKTGGDCAIEAGGNVTANAEGDVSVTAGGKCDIESGGNATIKALEITLDAPTVSITGAVKIAKTLSVSQSAEITADATIGGKTFLTHKHTSSASGTPTTIPI